MKYYRIKYTNKETDKSNISPVVMQEDEAIRRCAFFNKEYRRADHVLVDATAEDYKKWMESEENRTSFEDFKYPSGFWG
jgi:hypothetical protein